MILRPDQAEAARVPPPAGDPLLHVLGVRILNVGRQRAIELLQQRLHCAARPPASVYFVNAHTLNLASADPEYRAVLNASDFVFSDGTGVRWAARLYGSQMCENLNGTDFTPALLERLADGHYSYFLLGADAETIEVTAGYAGREFPAWRQAGYHHGYLTNPATSDAAIKRINASHADLLLVGMGNPIQEKWIHYHRDRLDVSLCLGIGGLFDFWSGNVSRAPAWLRWMGHEWLWRLYQQPLLKARRYLVGNPLFLARVLRDSRRARRARSG